MVMSFLMEPLIKRENGVMGVGCLSWQQMAIQD